jgi:hypothetical protein
LRSTRKEYAKKGVEIPRKHAAVVQGAKDNEMERIRAVKQQQRQQKWANRVVSKRLAKSNPDKFLRDTFFDGHGNDEGGPPVTLENLIRADRAHLHQAASDYRLFHETSITKLWLSDRRRMRLTSSLLSN